MCNYFEEGKKKLTVGSYSKIDIRTLIAPEHELFNHTSKQKRKTTVNNKFTRLRKTMNYHTARQVYSW